MANDPELYALLAQYAKAAHAWIAAMDSGRSEQSNEAYEIVAVLVPQIRAMGFAGHRGIASLMTDDRVELRVAAATHSLRFDPATAVAVLEMAASGPPSFTRLNAYMVLKQWRAGLYKGL